MTTKGTAMSKTWRLPALVVLAATMVTPARSAADAASLSGTWSGGGSIVLANGQTEKARCRVTFSPYGPRSYAMSAVCATASARVEQTAKVRSVGTNLFAGNFRNADYNISGTVNLKLTGSKLSASLSGGGAAAHLSLSR